MPQAVSIKVTDHRPALQGAPLQPQSLADSARRLDELLGTARGALGGDADQVRVADILAARAALEEAAPYLATVRRAMNALEAAAN